MWELGHRGLLGARAAALPGKFPVVKRPPESHLRSEADARYLSDCLKRWLIIPIHRKGLNLFAEIFMRYGPRDYRNVLAEYQKSAATGSRSKPLALDS
jgi:hypothetical protein